MCVVAMRDRADQTHFVHQPGHVWQMLANLQTGDRGLNRLEFAPDFHRCIGFQVKHIHLTRTAEQIKQDDRFDLSRSAGCRRFRGL